VGSDLRDPFERGKGGPGGWWILPEPGIELPNTPEIAPDVAGWRREHTITAYRLEAGRWLELGIFGDERDARIEPFVDVALDVASWWA
jgi:hypothetical protein